MGHTGGVGGHTHVGLLDLLGSLSTESELGTSLGSDSTRDHASDSALVAGELHEESLTGESRASLGRSRAAHESKHLPLGSSDGETEVLLGNGSSRTDGIGHLLLKLSTGSLGLQGDGLEGRVGLLGELGHLSLQAEFEGSLGPLVHGTARLEDSSSTLLTLLDSSAEGRLELSLVGLLEGSDELAARAGASLVAAECSLGATHAVHHVEAHTASGSLHGSVLLELGSLLASQSAVQTASGTAEGALGVLAVT